MEVGILFFLFLLVASTEASEEVILQPDQPSLQVSVSDTADLTCCYKYSVKLTVAWNLCVMISHNHSYVIRVNTSERVEITEITSKMDVHCMSLKLKNIMVTDTGLYLCAINQTAGTKDTFLYTPGTYLQVFKPMSKTLNISEQAKNSIITAEGVLLLLCVLLPGTLLLCKSKGLDELEKRKGKEENIYEGLNLDDCNSTYHQIQRSQVQGPYQDVVTTVGEDIQLEKP
ncbi:B-cell antigen receptor complex-associated protein alpha chain [Electrophorus electricus]|uniref:Immunoglobulin domain-containing protein n=1 Tax=Electrophorus electricus TaxID=8005 RepID=A0A4W4H352_ELEEL|nr:B-cell antigen receptor complex-associated protein alpha chain [Electrophorus electricus]